MSFPRSLYYRCGKSAKRAHARIWRTTVAAQPDIEALRNLDTLRQDRPGFLTVPNQMRRSISQVAAELALKLPTSTLTDQEMSLFLAGAGIEAPRHFEPARRGFSGTLSALPPWEVAGQQFLNLACLHPTAYRPVAKLIDIALGDRSLFDYRSQATAAELNLLIRACGHLVARGYAEGLRATLSRHVPELHGMGRDSPHLSKPWILVTLDQNRLIGIRAIWRSIDASESTADLIEEEDTANQRRARSRRRSENTNVRHR